MPYDLKACAWWPDSDPIKPCVSARLWVPADGPDVIDPYGDGADYAAAIYRHRGGYVWMAWQPDRHGGAQLGTGYEPLLSDAKTMATAVLDTWVQERLPPTPGRETVIGRSLVEGFSIAVDKASEAGLDFGATRYSYDLADGQHATGIVFFASGPPGSPEAAVTAAVLEAYQNLCRAYGVRIEDLGPMTIYSGKVLAAAVDEQAVWICAALAACLPLVVGPPLLWRWHERRLAQQRRDP